MALKPEDIRITREAAKQTYRQQRVESIVSIIDKVLMDEYKEKEAVVVSIAGTMNESELKEFISDEAIRTSVVDLYKAAGWNVEFKGDRFDNMILTEIGTPLDVKTTKR